MEDSEDEDDGVLVEDDELSSDEADEMDGGEDGEEPWDEDEVDTERYAQL